MKRGGWHPAKVGASIDEINRQVRELFEDPAVRWPSELPGPRWR